MSRRDGGVSSGDALRHAGELEETEYTEFESSGSDKNKLEIELFQSSIARISALNQKCVAEGQTGISEPGLERNPRLRNMEEYEDWIQRAEEYVIRRGRKEEGIVGEIIELEDIQKDVIPLVGNSKRCRHASIVGGAGTGKTTLARRIARDGSRGKYEKLKGKVLILPDFRNFPIDKELLPSEFLLDALYPEYTKPEVLNEKYQWMIEHPEKVVFIIDSLDTLPFNFEDERKPIGYHDKTTVDILLHNLLAGDLFKQSDILSTSREYKVRNLHPSVRPDRCIVLEGLSEDASRDLITGFLGNEKGKEMVNYVDTKCPDIWPLLSTPVFLVFSVIAFIQEGFRAKTLTGILIKFFISIIAKSKKPTKTRDIIRKLIPLSYKGVFHGRVLFTAGDLRDVGLTPGDVTEIGILIPQSGGTYLSTKLMQNDRFYLYFNHQTEQECLAAFYVLSMDLTEYRSFLKAEIHEPRFSVVRRMVCGVLLNNEVLGVVKELIELSDIEQRQEILLESLGNAMKSHRGPDSNERLPDLLIALAEGIDGAGDYIRSSLRRITLTNVPLSVSDAHAVASIMKQCTYLSSVCLTGCNMNDEKLDAIVGPVMQSSLKVNEFHSSDSDLGMEGIKKLAILVKHLEVKGLEIARNKLDADRLQMFHMAASGMKLNRLDVSGNVGIKGAGMSRLGELVLDFGVSNLKAEKCDLVYEDLKNLTESSKDALLSKLNVHGSKKLGPNGMFCLGEFVRNRGVRDLNVSHCNPTPQDLLKLAEGLEEAKVDILNLRNMVKKLPYTEALLHLIRHVKVQFNLQGWKISGAECRELQNKLNDMPRTELEIMVDKGKEIGAFLKADPCDVVESGVDDQGGEVEVAGSKINFLPDAFPDKSQISASSSMGKSSIPEKYLTISRLLHINSSSKPLVSAMIEIPIWASTDNPTIMAKVLCKKDGDGYEWREIKTIPLRDIRSRIVKIGTGEFNWLVIAIEDPYDVTMTAIKFHGQAQLSYNHNGDFDIRFFVDGRMNQDSNDPETQKSILFSNQSFSIKDTIQLDFSCEPEKFSFLWQKEEYEVDKNFLFGSRTYYFKTGLKPIPDPKTDITISYSVKRNRKSMVKGAIRISWPEATISSDAQKMLRRGEQSRTMLPGKLDGFFKEKILGRDGGPITNHGCNVTFPSEALSTDSTIETTVLTRVPRRREDRVPIGPLLKCGPSGTLNKPVLIEIQLWLVPLKSGMFAEVNRKDEDDSEWKFVKKIPIDMNGKISFYTQHFTVFETLGYLADWAWTKMLGRPFFQIPLRNLVYIRELNQTIACVCCLDDSAVKDEVAEILKGGGFIPLLPHPEVAKGCREVRMRIKCIQPENMMIRPSLEPQVRREIEKVFTPITVQAKKWKFYYPTIDAGDIGDDSSSLTFRYEQTIDGVDDEAQPMETAWPIPDLGSSQGRQYNFYGDIEGNFFL